ncbi:leucine-rich repeat protein [Tanacetum coccineum]|uniref:Leucine-rich repeat protein n=1 Tax=Tanacetum coccineum TaxID=301880 RepID=A0ABQ5A229_9ASTR
MSMKGDKWQDTSSNSHLKSLKSLKFLNLGYNLLSGNFPESLLTSLPSLEGLTLYNNKLSGPINKHIRVASNNLTDLDLSNNRFQGPLPEFIFKLPSISTLKLSGNNFSGSVHLDVFGKLKNLSELDLSYNDLTVIPNTNEPSSFSSLVNLETVGLASCKMLKYPNLKNHVSLRNLDLSDNLFKGEIPNWIWNLGNGSLGSLKLSHNKFSSLQKPYTFPSLNLLDLSSNKLKGDIPVPPTGIYVVNYSNNKFGSSIPVDFGDALITASSFSISHSKVVGIIPKSINKARLLRKLDLSSNSLTGTIPLDGSTGELDTLDLSNNKISGRIPEQLTRLVSLEFLNVSYNRLSGKIPQGGRWFPTFTNLSYEGNKGLCGPPLRKTCFNFMERYYKRKFSSISDDDGEETLTKRIPETMTKPIPKPTPIPSSSDGINLEIRDDVFSLLVDESSDVSKKEQMALVLRYVDRLGIVKERFASVVHVDDTSSKTLKASNDTLFAQHKLSQGYDGASNMRSEFNGLKALILKDNSSAYYVHFSSSCKRIDMIQDNYKVRIEAEISEGVIETGRGLNQEITLIRPEDTRWGSHHKRNYQNILEGVLAINELKESLITLRANGFDNILKKVNIFCTKYDITVLKMDEACAAKRNRIVGTNRHYFEINIFNTVLDMQIQEFGDRFSEISTHLLSNMSALGPRASFTMFDASKLITLTTLYPDDFTDSDRFHLIRELDLYRVNVVQNEDFSKLIPLQSLLRRW